MQAILEALRVAGDRKLVVTRLNLCCRQWYLLLLDEGVEVAEDRAGRPVLALVFYLLEEIEGLHFIVVRGRCLVDVKGRPQSRGA